MNCQEVRNQLPDLLRNDLEGGEAERVRGHLHSCPACWQEWSELHEIWTRLGILPEEQPSPELRRKFYRRLEESRREIATADRLSWKQGWRRFLPAWGLASPVMGLAAAALIVLAGFGIGYVAGGRNREDSTRLQGLSREVEQLQQQVSLSLLGQSSASARLQGLSMTARLQDPEPELLKTLLEVLDTDPSVNVRLSTVDALYLFVDRAEVRTALSASLTRQTSPLVQIALIDLLVSLKEKQAAVALRKLLNDDKIIPEVQKRAQLGISKII
jgi:predicted anti-sigma-YlaC factor YlaD